MNKSNLKSYAPQARKDFIAAVTARANLLGLADKAGTLEVAPAQTQGDVTLIAGQAWPAKVSGQRDKLIERIRKDGFAHTMEAVAYTWFNRFAALRYMELHDYLGHGHRALSSASGGLPDILTHATDLINELPGLNAAKVTELKLAGNRDGELYRMLLVAQCNALSRAMPFLFERIDDDSELLLPDNLLRSDSVIAKLVAEIPEEDWAEVEIIGWLYQFYISEKKDQVIGKVVKSEDIPAATQLFTPNWIVQYLVQNSVGRLWLMANPQSTLASEWPYYITPAEQTPEVQAQLDALIQTRVREDGDTLNPESITVLDPACGSGHILVVAYDVLKAIYLERGYQPRTIPRQILEKNLYGLDIDDRAAQMAGFALLMKARADDRRLFTATDDAGNLQPPKLNVLSLQESKGLSVDELATHLAPFQVQRATIAALVETFEHAKTFGSLIQIPYALKTHLAVLPQVLALVKQSGDMYANAAADDLLPLVQQARVLAMQFDAVVANPPYMGGKYLTPVLKAYLKDNFKGFEKDLFSAFMVRDLSLTKSSGQLGFMSPFVWMFISSYEDLRLHFLNCATLTSLIQLEYSGFDGATVPICTFTLDKHHAASYLGSYVRLSDFRGADQQGPKTLEALHNPNCSWFHTAKPDDFKKIPGSPIAYWVTEKMHAAFLEAESLGTIAQPRQGMATTNNSLFVRLWFETSQSNTNLIANNLAEALESKAKWFPYNKGGDFRRWYGNNLFVVNYENGGKTICDYIDNTPGVNVGSNGRVINREKYFKPSITWSKISSSSPAFRYIPSGFIFDVAGTSIFFDSIPLQNHVVGFCNSTVATKILQILSPTLNFEVGHISTLPIRKNINSDVITPAVKSLIAISKSDWDSYEASWDFRHLSWVSGELKNANLNESWRKWCQNSEDMLLQMKSLEEENNRIFIEAYDLQSEFSPEVPDSQITLTRADREKDSQRLISYAIGCMMGRYSLDEPGLIYAHAGNVGFDPGRYATFPADADGIVPITDELWFADDAPSRIREFLRAVWGPDTLEENMAWLAESLGTKASETPDETIRRYIADKFFKDHLQTYKKRPIYWLFSSGKQGAFQALVYLHRYHEGTLARLRAEYVVPLTGKIQSRIEMLQKDANVASSTAARNKLAKEVEKLKKKHVELLAYDEQLRHYADMRITLDLDDGVKVNYGKFGDLLEGVKVVTGGTGDD
ncbi:type II restriction enzyme [Alicycliphilus sp. B1]|nr:type II restriction enzyme [Alicycliphilus sp. B1]